MSTATRYKEHAHHCEENAQRLLAKEPAAQAALEAWHAEAKNAEWSAPADVKAAVAAIYRWTQSRDSAMAATCA